MKLKVITFLIASLFISPVMAGDGLSADEVKTLFSNKTFDIDNLETGKKLSAFDSADGIHTVYIPWKDKTKKRKWWLDGNMHCTSHPKKGDTCKIIKNAGDGVYHGYVNGKHTRTLSNFRDGNQL